MLKQLVITILLSILFGFTVHSQDLNKMDAQGLRHGKWQKNFEGTQQIRYSGTFEHGKEIGTFKFYDKRGGHPTAIKIYTDGNELLDVIFYTTSGKKISEGKMKGRTKEGDWMYYHKDGTTLMIKEFYVNDKLNGERLVYFSNGKLAQKSSYVNNIQEGSDTVYNDNGALKIEQNFVNGKLDGNCKIYDYSGQLIREGSYKANRKHGVWKYYKDGKLLKEEKFPKNKFGVVD